jgi:predicted phage tail component-like protein
MLNFNSIDSGDFYFNGRWLSDLGGVIAGQNGLSPFSLTPQLQTKTEKILGRDGELIYDATYSPRTFTIPVMFNDATWVREIAGWLNARKAIPFYFKNDTVQIDCLIDSALELNAFSYQGIVELKFIAHSPFYYSITDRKIIVNKSASASTNTNLTTNTVTQNVTAITNVTVVNEGNMESYPVYKLVGAGDLSLIVNGNQFTIKGVTDYVLVDVQYCTAKRDGAVPVNFIGNMDGKFEVFQAGNNTITASDNCTSIEIQCRSRWI